MRKLIRIESCGGKTARILVDFFFGEGLSEIIIENIDFLQGKRDKDGDYKEPENNSSFENPFSDDDIPL